MTGRLSADTIWSTAALSTPRSRESKDNQKFWLESQPVIRWVLPDWRVKSVRAGFGFNLFDMYFLRKLQLHGESLWPDSQHLRAKRQQTGREMISAEKEGGASCAVTELIPKPHSLHGDVWSYTATTMWGHQRWTEVSERRTQLRHNMCNQPRFSDGAVRPSFTCIYLIVQAHFLTRALWDLWKYVQGQKSRSKTLHLPQDISGFIKGHKRAEAVG